MGCKHNQADYFVIYLQLREGLGSMEAFFKDMTRRNDKFGSGDMPFFIRCAFYPVSYTHLTLPTKA